MGTHLLHYTLQKARKYFKVELYFLKRQSYIFFAKLYQIILMLNYLD